MTAYEIPEDYMNGAYKKHTLANGIVVDVSSQYLKFTFWTRIFD